MDLSDKVTFQERQREFQREGGREGGRQTD
jgi:hypothetical protein